MLVLVQFSRYVHWSNGTLNKKISQTISYLNEHKIPHFKQPIESNLCDSIAMEVDKERLSEFSVFVTKTLKAPVRCIHIPYQTLSVDGLGKVEVMNYSPSLDQFFFDTFGELNLPNIYSLRERRMKCYLCGDEAEYIFGGFSECLRHFEQTMRKYNRP